MDVIRHLHQRSTLDKLTRGAIASTTSEFKVHRSTISRIWKTFHQNALLPSLKAGRVGRPTVYTPEVVASTVRELPLSLRGTMRDMSKATGIPLPSLHRALKAGTIQRRSTRIKPLLTDENRAERLAFCHSHVRPSGPHGSRSAASGAGKAGLSETVVLDDMWDVVHLDENWFNADKNIRKIYLTAARPRYDEARGMCFDGKLGIWLFLEFAPAARNSRNRPAGTLVPSLVNVDADVYRNYVMTRVIPGIKAKFPSASKRVVLQHDNRSLNQ
ncbi:hypothetical protein H257_09559 [Aphanomyces astaci]|uniref:DUF7769 domain-containing protein n=1 Tax=Aphanomyces astaci TaxID=112090 RepID=W4GA84_APHAT|nr:hypothetical protein H257_09559 [Aphanomyces astaci]ETV76560.1 hypothetical protein H257_09559 [Aphanomyces astaci]|eukprot:XP_009834105.1 hypothetical protein H257_09559 [Aphanomyces astaci]